MWHTLRISLLLLVGFLGSCETLEKEVEEVPLENQITRIKKAYAPDKRVALFQVTASKGKEGYVLKGESNLPEAVQALKEKLSAENIAFTDSIQLLPSLDLQGKTEGLITISVANLRSNPKHSAELATQATLGTPVKIYKREGDWSLVQTPDGYLAWVDQGGISTRTLEELETWQQNDKIIYTQTYGHAYIGPSTETPRVSDVVAGNIFELLNEQNGFYAVRYPDGRKAYLNRSESEPYQEWLASVDTTGESLVTTSKQLMGLPYLWGGTSTKGVDCSGFTKTVFFLNGMIIPRDASQQVHTGVPIDSTQNFDSLEKGDLLFFGRKATDSTAEKVVHVGMWIGNNEFIHSSGQVHISSMDENAGNFDAFNRNRYLRTKRLLQQEEGLISLTKTSLFKE